MTLTSTLRLALLAAAVVVVLPFIIAAFWLTPTTKSEQLLPDDHPLEKIISVMNSEFPVSGTDRKVRWAWAIYVRSISCRPLFHSG